MNWYYVDGPLRVGPLSEAEWAPLVRSGKIQPETLVWHAALTKWTPYSEVRPQPEPEMGSDAQIVESSDELSQESFEEVGSPEAFAARVADRPYTVGVLSCISRSWRLLTSNFWMLIGSTLLIYVLIHVGKSVPGLVMAMLLSLDGVLMGGLYIVYLRLMRGQVATARDLFSGFAPGLFRNLALQTFVTALVVVACFIPLVIAIEMALGKALVEKLSNGRSIDPGAFLNLFAAMEPMKLLVLTLIGLACALPVIYFRFCWMLAVPLIADKKLRFWPAMRLSRKKVLQHPWRISLLLIVAGLITAIPLLFWALLSGPVAMTMDGVAKASGMATLLVALTQPVFIGAVLYLYRDMFGDGDVSGRRESTPEEPPSDEF